MTQIAYTFDPVTRCLSGTIDADQSPLEPGQYILPHNACWDGPPATSSRQVAVRAPVNDRWEIVEDWRGVALYSTVDGSPASVDRPGPLPAGLTDIPPPTPAHRWAVDAWVFDQTLEESRLSAESVELCGQIDAAADTARAKVVGDPTRAEEYKLAAAEAESFRTAGYPADAVPRTVAAWAIGGRTAQQAADDILSEAAQYNEALYLLRETRLQAKDQVRQAMDAGNVAQAQDITAETIASIQAAVAGVGNASIQA